jgi:hypothetical protein
MWLQMPLLGFFGPQLFDANEKVRKFVCGNRSYDLVVDAEAVMNHLVPDPRQVFPG